MLLGLIGILGCQVVGQFLVTAFGLQVPGPALGMALFFVVLMIRRRRHGGTEPRDAQRTGWQPERAAERLLDYLPLFFVPAGVGVIEYLGWLAPQWWAVVAALFGGWLVALTTTAGTAVLAARLTHHERDSDG